MYDLLKYQMCPYCESEVDDSEANWSEDEETVTCSRCKKEYEVRAIYQFQGFQIEKKCEECGEWTDDGMFLCDCEEDD